MDIFVKNSPEKTRHAEKITMRGYVITCGCGAPWFAAVLALNSEGRELMGKPLQEHRCPECGNAPTKATTSAIEERTEVVFLEKPKSRGPSPLQHATGLVRIRR